MKIRDDTGTYDSDGTFTPPANGQAPPSDWRSIFDAPAYTDLIKPAQTAKAKEYSAKVKSMLKSGTVAAIKVEDFPDAAAILAYGPGFADACGQMADQSDWAEKAIDILTSPASAPLTFALTASTFLMQLARNHEHTFQELPNARRNAKLRKQAMKDARKAEPPRFKIRIFGREWGIRYQPKNRFKGIFGAFRAQTQEPTALTYNVFTDPRVLAMLKKQGIVLVAPNDSPPAT
jgi:hypothetical protein